jgi:diphthamide synthase (EF-2-diphthine--ammonia ligase)
MAAKALIAWSSGKDSAWALHEARRSGEYEIVGALTTVTETFAPIARRKWPERELRRYFRCGGGRRKRSRTP